MCGKSMHNFFINRPEVLRLPRFRSNHTQYNPRCHGSSSKTGLPLLMGRSVCFMFSRTIISTKQADVADIAFDKTMLMTSTFKYATWISYMPKLFLTLLQRLATVLNMESQTSGTKAEIRVRVYNTRQAFRGNAARSKTRN